MQADEQTVDRIIAETLDRHGGEGSPDPDVWEAQNELYDKRTYDPALAGDENYVIAEHYMLSRAMVASCQVPIEQLLAQVQNYAAPQEGTLAPATRPGCGAPVPTSMLAVRKLTQGARDGERQRLLNGRPKPEFNTRAFAACRAFHKVLKR